MKVEEPCVFSVSNMAEEDGENGVKKALEQCAMVQSMIDISAEHLNGLRTICATSAELTQQEIRTLEVSKRATYYCNINHEINAFKFELSFPCYARLGQFTRGKNLQSYILNGVALPSAHSNITGALLRRSHVAKPFKKPLHTPVYTFTYRKIIL